MQKERKGNVQKKIKEIREEIWSKFKDASAVINKKYQAYFAGNRQPGNGGCLYGRNYQTWWGERKYYY